MRCAKLLTSWKQYFPSAPAAVSRAFAPLLDGTTPWSPTRAATSPESRPSQKRPPTALTADDLRRLHRWLSSDERSIERDLPDLVLFLAATGLRIGEARRPEGRHRSG